MSCRAATQHSNGETADGAKHQSGNHTVTVTVLFLNDHSKFSDYMLTRDYPKLLKVKMLRGR